MIRYSTRPTRRIRIALGSALLLSLLSLAGHPASAAPLSVGRAAVRSATLPADLAPVVARTLPRGAAVPAVTWSQQAEITRTGFNQGFSGGVALDGNTALVSATFARQGQQGEVFVFVRSGATWTKQAVLTGFLSVDAYFGQSLALSGDTALVGAPYTLNPPQGAVYVFVRHGTTWGRQAVLTSSDGIPNDSFGWSVALSGETALIGALDRNNFLGAAYVFVRHGTAWSQQSEFTAPDCASYCYFGGSVALSGDTALVGSTGTNGGLNGIGAAYVFVRNGTTWTQQAELASRDQSADERFGSAVAIDGNTALISADYKNSVTGAAYVFARSGSTWSQRAELTASDASAYDWFGYFVALRGGTALIGAPALYPRKGIGAAYVFARSGTTWTQQSELHASDGQLGDEFGISVALSGGPALVSAPGKSFKGGQGAAYVFVRG